MKKIKMGQNCEIPASVQFRTLCLIACYLKALRLKYAELQYQLFCVGAKFVCVTLREESR
jgi:hypothetical protein